MDKWWESLGKVSVDGGLLEMQKMTLTKDSSRCNFASVKESVLLHAEFSHSRDIITPILPLIEATGKCCQPVGR